MTDVPPRNHETKIVLALAGALVIALGVLTLTDASLDPRALHATLARGVASIDPGLQPAGDTDGAAVAAAEGKIVVAGLPEGFYVRLDGLAYPRGTTPDLAIEASPGTHRLEIVNHSGEAWVTRVTVPAGAAVTAHPSLAGEIVLEAAPGERPAGRVFLDGRPVPDLPATIDPAQLGRHVVEVRSDTGVVWQSEIEVRNAALTRVEIPRLPDPQGN